MFWKNADEDELSESIRTAMNSISAVSPRSKSPNNSKHAGRPRAFSSPKNKEERQDGHFLMTPSCSDALPSETGAIEAEELWKAAEKKIGRDEIIDSDLSIIMDIAVKEIKRKQSTGFEDFRN